MRLFIAINLSKEMKNNLKKIQDSLRSKGIQGRYTPEENLHLTLVFIGNYPDPDAILDIMEQIDFEPFRIKLEGYGNFDDLCWAGIQSSEELAKIVRALRRILAQDDIPFDRKRFIPHITLVRKTVFPERFPSLSFEPVTMMVDRISLMRSDRGKNQMIYTEIGHIST